MLRYLLPVFLLIIARLPGYSQTSYFNGPTCPVDIKAKKELSSKFNQNTTLIWSENFSGGIPSDWINTGYDVDTVQDTSIVNPALLWEYRGASTSPNNSVGTRGGNKGNSDPMFSPTSTNGYIIFDSDYYNGGATTPAPHTGTLTTDTIDCSGHPFVELSFGAYARKYSSSLMVAVSKDGGVSYDDTVEFHTDVRVNGSSLNGERMVANISKVAGNEPNVVLQFIFDGSVLVNGARECGGYFWMIDDIELKDLPKDAVRFVRTDQRSKIDIIYPPGMPKYGSPQIDMAQYMPISFSASVLNYGIHAQTNLNLVVHIYDELGVLQTTLTSSPILNLPSGNIATHQDLTTNYYWVPPYSSSNFKYYAVASIEADSINMSIGIKPSDTLMLNYEPWVHGSHFSNVHNTLGTGNDIIAIAQKITFPACDFSNEDVHIEGLSVFIGPDSDTTGQLIIEIYNGQISTGSAGGPSGNPITVKSAYISASDLGHFKHIDLTNSGLTLLLPHDEEYYVIFNLLSGWNDPVQIGNDQTVVQDTPVVFIQSNSGEWFHGFQNSDLLTNVAFEIEFYSQWHQPPYPCSNISLPETMTTSFSIYPNPTARGELNISFPEGGSYLIELIDATGRTHHREMLPVDNESILTRRFHKLPAGIYWIRISSDHLSHTEKLIIR